jgi:H+/Cl- antiporter ClcA
MQTESLTPPLERPAAPRQAAAEDELADFTTDHRVLLLSAMALVIGAIGAVVAYALLWLISAITNLAFYQRFSTAGALPQGNHLGWWVVLAPVVGALIIGLMARYGSEKIRGHGIPEALEAILLGRSRIASRWPSSNRYPRPFRLERADRSARKVRSS